jgi:hypothetical protein
VAGQRSRTCYGEHPGILNSNRSITQTIQGSTARPQPTDVPAHVSISTQQDWRTALMRQQQQNCWRSLAPDGCRDRLYASFSWQQAEHQQLLAEHTASLAHLSCSHHPPASVLVSPPVSSLAGSTAVASPAAATHLGRSCCLTAARQVLAAQVVAHPRQRCYCCYSPAMPQGICTQLTSVQILLAAAATFAACTC